MKCFSPAISASLRGKPIEISADGACELSPEELAEMRPHGFREWEPGDEKRAQPVKKRANGGE